MRTADPEPNQPTDDHSEFLKATIDEAQNARRATSRHELAEILAKRAKMPHRDALSVVDVYCDINNPGIPDYLSSEFAIGWLKFLAVIPVSVGVAALWQGVQHHQRNQVTWPWWCAGVVLVGAGVFYWVKSLEREAERRRS